MHRMPLHDAIACLHEREDASHIICRTMETHPMDWLLQLPQSTLFDIMQRRSRLIGCIYRWLPGTNDCTQLTTEGVMMLETRMAT